MNAGGDSNKCKVCGSTEDLMYAVVTSKPLDISSPEENNYHYLCEEHYENIIENTKYHVRELPLDENVSDIRRYEDEEGYLVIYSKDEDEEKWFRIPRRVEEMLEDNT